MAAAAAARFARRAVRGDERHLSRPGRHRPAQRQGRRGRYGRPDGHRLHRPGGGHLSPGLAARPGRLGFSRAAGLFGDLSRAIGPGGAGRRHAAGLRHDDRRRSCRDRDRALPDAASHRDHAGHQRPRGLHRRPAARHRRHRAAARRPARPPAGLSLSSRRDGRDAGGFHRAQHLGARFAEADLLAVRADRRHGRCDPRRPDRAGRSRDVPARRLVRTAAAGHRL